MVTRWSQNRGKALHLWLLPQSPRDTFRLLHLCCAGRFRVPTWVSYQSSASLRLFSTKVSYWHLISSRTRFRSTGGAASTSTLSRSPSWQRSEFTSCDTDEGLFLGDCITRTHLSSHALLTFTSSHLLFSPAFLLPRVHLFLILISSPFCSPLPIVIGSSVLTFSPSSPGPT